MMISGRRRHWLIFCFFVLLCLVFNEINSLDLLDGIDTSSQNGLDSMIQVSDFFLLLFFNINGIIKLASLGVADVIFYFIF